MRADPVLARTSYPLDPELARAARLYRVPDHADPLAVRRELSRRRKASMLTGAWTAQTPGVEWHDVELLDGAVPLAVRIYLPADVAGPRAAVLSLHGGAFLSGDLEFEHHRLLELCRATSCAVAAVDYRLAPEHPYPAALDDTVRAYRWLRGAGGAACGIDPDRTAVVGTSAGGALAAALCLHEREHGRPQPRMQLLLFPVVDDRLTTPSSEAFTDTPILDRDCCVHMWRHYLGPEPAEVPPFAAPARARDLAGLPPAYVVTAQFDPLRDEGLHHARRLLEAGVPTELHQFPRAFHGFDSLVASASAARRARIELHEVLHEVLGAES